MAFGRHNDYRTLAFSIYKIACDFSAARQTSSTRSLLSAFTDYLFGRPAPGAAAQIRERIAVMRLRTTPFGSAVGDLVEGLRAQREASLDVRLDVAYEHIARVADELVRMLLDSARRHLAEGDVGALARDVSASLSAAFVAAPFFSTANILSRGRRIGEEVATRMGVSRSGGKHVLWFTDTIADLNGVSVTLRSMAQAARRRGDQLLVATCLSADESFPGVLNIPQIAEFELPFYECQRILVPSALRALKLVQEFDPDEIVVSTPGPLGLLGLACARLADVPCKAVYHTDFAAQLALLGNDEAPVDLVAAGERWFYGSVDEVLVPTESYLDELARRGIPRERMSRFRRGFDSAVFSPRAVDPHFRHHYGLPTGPLALYVGRISHDKDISLLLEAHRAVLDRIPNAGLLLVGSGPHLDELLEASRTIPGVVFAGSRPNAQLPTFYSACDLFVFPSVTDTFGMAVLEAQACMLPAIVSNIGGPQEVVVPGRSGSVLSERKPEAWAAEMMRLYELRSASPAAFGAMRESAWRNALTWSWDGFLDELFEIQTPVSACVPAIASEELNGDRIAEHLVVS
jgi:glycosyltransferase involved in cell wall biosynthesis